MKRLVPLILALMTFSGLAIAKTVYIGDTLYVPLRSGPGNEYRIVNRALKTGTPLTLLDEEQQDGFYRVQTSDGQDGFVPGQYIIFDPPAMLQLTSVQKQNSQLQAQVKELTTQLKQTEASLKEQALALNSSNQKVSSLQAELNRIKTISSKSLELDNRNQELVTTNEQLMGELQALQSTNQQLTDSDEQRWFIYGVGTLAFGLLIGLVAPLVRPKKKSSDWA